MDGNTYYCEKDRGYREGSDDQEHEEQREQEVTDGGEGDGKDGHDDEGLPGSISHYGYLTRSTVFLPVGGRGSEGTRRLRMFGGLQLLFESCYDTPLFPRENKSTVPLLGDTGNPLLHHRIKQLSKDVWNSKCVNPFITRWPAWCQWLVTLTFRHHASLLHRSAVPQVRVFSHDRWGHTTPRWQGERLWIKWRCGSRWRPEGVS